MNKQVQWLMKELDGWVGRGLISQEQALQIRGLYPEAQPGLPWGTIIFSGIGAVITGLGVILLLAYNWAAIPKMVKLGIVFGALMGFYASGIRMFVQTDWRKQLGETLCLFGTMMFGAGIWLIAQIYHIDEHFPNGFLIWGVGALAMAWVMPSLAQGLLATLLLSIWACAEAWGFHTAIHVGPLLILVAIGGLACRMRSALLLYFVLPAFLITLMANISVFHDTLMLRAVLNFSVLFVALGLLARRHQWFPNSAGALNFYGWFGFLFSLFVLTFPDSVKHLLERTAASSGDTPQLLLMAYDWGPLLLVVTGWSVLAWPWRPGAPREKRPEDCTFEFSLLPLTAIFCQVLTATGIMEDKWSVAAIFNLCLLALAATWMSRGCRTGALRPTILGSLLLAALVWARYLDLFDSLFTRGLVFLIGGGIFIAEGVLFRSARRRAQQTEVRK
jgi:uncharacterized membrane protein